MVYIAFNKLNIINFSVKFKWFTVRFYWSIHIVPRTRSVVAVTVCITVGILISIDL